MAWLVWEHGLVKKKRGAAVLSPIRHRLSKADRLFEAGKQKEAFAVFAALAKKGVAEAQHRVGQCYLGGMGVPASLEEGTRWMYRAAQAGHADACFSLGTLYVMGLPEGFDPAEEITPALAITSRDEGPRKVDYTKALYWARKGGEAGNADSCALVGYILSNAEEDLRDLPQARQWYERAAQDGAAQGYYGFGLILLKEAQTEEDRVRAADYFHKAAEMEISTAYAILGWMYEEGFGVTADIEKAAAFFLQAAESGIASSQARYGLMLLKGVGVEENITRAESWLRRAAHNGNADAAATLGDLYIRGDAFLQNPVDALKWYHFAAENGHIPAARALAVMYLAGAGTHRDLKKAGYWFDIAARNGDRYADADLGNLILAGGFEGEEKEIALQSRFQTLAEQGDQLAAFNLGVCLAQGIGGPKDEEKALVWLKQSLDGVVNAQYWYGRLIIEAGGRLGDVTEGLKWVEKAAEAGMAEACATLAQILVSGQIAPRNHGRALQLYTIAAEGGNIDALFSLGAMYGGGHDVPENREMARDYFDQAAHQGHALAQMMLGRYLVAGLGGPVDLEEGRRWLKMAASAGIEEAGANLRHLDESLGRSGKEKKEKRDKTLRTERETGHDKGQA